MTEAVDLRRAELRAAYDATLRREAEMLGADDVSSDGPLLRGRFGTRGFVTYRSLDGLDGNELDALISATIAHFAETSELDVFEWKTRGHDTPADLPARLEAHGFVAEEIETVMVGEAASLVGEVVLPDGVVVRRAGSGQTSLAADLRDGLDLQDQVFGRTTDIDDHLSANEAGDDEQYWLAVADGGTVATGRLSVIPDTRFAGLWGGCVDPRWRGRGLYRALVAARTRAAIARGATLIHSDCSAQSRPILERSGLVAVTTTTPYLWHRHT